MPAPTALQRAPEKLANEEFLHKTGESAITDDNDGVLISTSANQPQEQDIVTQDEEALAANDMDVDTESRPIFAPESQGKAATRVEERKIRIPPHRMSPLKNTWTKIYPPLVEHLKLQVRMNVAKKAVELRTSSHTTDISSLQKGADFITAFTLGFDVDDAIALLRLDDLYIETFEIKDVKDLKGEHMGRAIGRIAGKDGKTKFAIENASRTRVVLADSKIHILGGFRNIHIAREAVVSLILGKPPGKVYGDLRTVAGRMKERF